MVKGQKHPMIISQHGISSLKLEVDWTDAEDDEALGNSNVLNANFNSVDKNMSRLINTCTKSKEA